MEFSIIQPSVVEEACTEGRRKEVMRCTAGKHASSSGKIEWRDGFQSVQR